MHPARALIVSWVVLGCSCAATAPRSHALNPLGWPSKGLLALGTAAADSELLLLRETGRLLFAVGELVDSPALFVEGVATLSGDKIAGSGKLLVVGTAGSVTAAINLPFFLTGGPTQDLGGMADDVNDALEYIERQPPQKWRAGPDDDRAWIFPPGTRVRASGKNLVWCFPDGAEVLQTAERSYVFQLVTEVTGTQQYIAQERSWGMVIPSPRRWKDAGRRFQTVVVIHELFHQYHQIREGLLGWSLAYWPAYGVDYALVGHRRHWAEGGEGARTIDRALQDWY